MGRLIKNHLARLIVLTAAMYQIAAAIEGFFCPKIFWDFLTQKLDKAVKPRPILQILNLATGLFIMAWEWPVRAIATTTMHQSIRARLLVLPFAALVAVLMYQATDPALYYVIGTGFYFWAYQEREVLSATLVNMLPTIAYTKEGRGIGTMVPTSDD